MVIDKVVENTADWKKRALNSALGYLESLERMSAHIRELLKETNEPVSNTLIDHLMTSAIEARDDLKKFDNWCKMERMIQHFRQEETNNTNV